NDYVAPHHDSGGYLYSNFSICEWPFLLMPYLGCNRTPVQYWFDTYDHGSLEIRSWVQNPPGFWRQYGYKTPEDTNTKASSVWFCPATRGPMGWDYPTASTLGWGWVFIDYA